MGLFMVILKDPEAARALGLLGAKAQLTAGTADWPTYWSLLGQAVTVGGSVLFAFLTAWVFGREFADRTVRGLLASATPRRTIVIAKALVIAVWGAAISGWVLLLSLVDRVADRPPGLVGFGGDPGARDDRVRRASDDRAAGDDRVLCRGRSRLHRAPGLGRRHRGRLAGPRRPGLGSVVPVGPVSRRLSWIPRCRTRSPSVRSARPLPRLRPPPRPRPTSCSACSSCSSGRSSARRSRAASVSPPSSASCWVASSSVPMRSGSSTPARPPRSSPSSA